VFAVYFTASFFGECPSRKFWSRKSHLAPLQKKLLNRVNLL